MLNVVDLFKQFSVERNAIDGVSFDIPKGDITVLLGPSGCGKTTTLRCVAGLEHPSAGRIQIDGVTVSAPKEKIQIAARHREVGMVFQSYAIWPHMSVLQNVMYPLKNRGMSREEMDRRAKEALDMVGLWEYAKRSATALSGGQMQRVALARSMSYSPKLLLLDEPLSNLDAKLRTRLRVDLRRIIKDIGVTALYVTHDQSEAVVIGDQIGVMNEGRLLQIASAQEIYNKPTDLFVASFTGATNTLAGRVMSRNDLVGIIDMGQGVQLEAMLPDLAKVGANVTVAIRPENINIAISTGTNTFQARVVSAQYQGSQTAYTLALFGGTIEAIELGSGVSLTTGQVVPISLPRELCWAFLDKT